MLPRSAETKYSGTLDGCAIGSSSCQTSLGSAPKKSLSSITTSCASAPMARATWRAYSSSLNARSLNATENVCERPVDHPRHERGDRAAVDAAGEEHAERHVAHQPQADGFFEQIAELLDDIGDPTRRGSGAALVRPARPSTAGSRSRRARTRASARAAACGCRGTSSRCPTCSECSAAPAAPPCSPRPRSRPLARIALISDPNSSASAGARPVERLDAEPIAHEQQPPPWRVPDRECEHAAEAVHAVVAPLFIRVDDGLGVRARAVAMPGRFELAADVGVVVDLAVEHDPDGAVFVGQRLLARARDRRCSDGGGRGAAHSSQWRPASSGPRWVMTSRMRRARAGAS